MTKIDIVSGYLGAGKTTLIGKIVEAVCTDEKVVYLENEYGEVRLNEKLSQMSSFQKADLSSGCICCGLSQSFTETLRNIIEWQSPDRIIIEPSGIVMLSDLIKKTSCFESLDVSLNATVTVVDVRRFDMYMRNLGEFYSDQIINAQYIFLSRTENAEKEKIHSCVEKILSLNGSAAIICAGWNNFSGDKIMNILKGCF